jgi:hypothetical protein
VLELASVVELVETTLQHLGPLHPIERVLTLVLAFGPFVLLAVTIWVARRRNARDSDRGSP